MLRNRLRETFLNYFDASRTVGFREQFAGSCRLSEFSKSSSVKALVTPECVRPVGASTFPFEHWPYGRRTRSAAARERKKFEKIQCAQFKNPQNRLFSFYWNRYFRKIRYSKKTKPRTSARYKPYVACVAASKSREKTKTVRSGAKTSIFFFFFNFTILFQTVMSY